MRFNTFMHSYERVNGIEEVAEIVQDHPSDRHKIVKLPEHSPANHHDQVVEDGHVDNPQPLVIRLKLKYILKGIHAHVIVIRFSRVYC